MSIANGKEDTLGTPNAGKLKGECDVNDVEGSRKFGHAARVI